MSRWGKLVTLVRIGALLMVVGNALVTSLGFEDSVWKYYVYIFPANLGQGIVYPGILFTSLATFDHAGEQPKARDRGDGVSYHVQITPFVPRQSTSSARWGPCMASPSPLPLCKPRSASGFRMLWARYQTNGEYAPFPCCLRCFSGARLRTGEILTPGRDAGHRRNPALGLGHQDSSPGCAAQSTTRVLRRPPVLVCGIHGGCCRCGVHRFAGQGTRASEHKVNAR